MIILHDSIDFWFSEPHTLEIFKYLVFRAQSVDISIKYLEKTLIKYYIKSMEKNNVEWIQVY